MTSLQEDFSIRKLGTNEKMPYDLLLLADPSIISISAYLPMGEVYVMEQERQIIGSYVIIQVNDAVEIKNIAVSPSLQGKGLGKRLLQDAAQRAKANGYKRICISTGNSSMAQLYLYQRQGFEITGIKKYFFIMNYEEPIYENGIQCKHLILLEKNLNG